MSRNLKPQIAGGRLVGLIGAGLAFYGLSNSLYNGNYKENGVLIYKMQHF